MTDIEIEKLADALARRLQPVVSTDMESMLEEKLNERLNFVVRRILTRLGEAIDKVAEDI